MTSRLPRGRLFAHFAQYFSIFYWIIALFNFSTHSGLVRNHTFAHFSELCYMDTRSVV